ncbi:MAG: hypothetical protein D6B27_00105 [Gammaproteobacteria bacterium]|nr:MAG: hypothetical protein D6B27_00105 [Gammaproteobacteria bacterium]
MHKKAFPTVKKDGSANTGMDLRDYFAAKAMQGFLSAGTEKSNQDIADEAYKLADDMIKERRESRIRTDVEF